MQIKYNKYHKFLVWLVMEEADEIYFDSSIDFFAIKPVFLSSCVKFSVRWFFNLRQEDIYWYF